MMDVSVNGDRIEFDEQARLDFSGVYIQKHNQSKIGIYFTSGVSMDTRAIEDFLVYQISIPTRFKGLYLLAILEIFQLCRSALCLKFDNSWKFAAATFSVTPCMILVVKNMGWDGNAYASPTKNLLEL